MRSFINGDGVDVTTASLAYRQANNQYWMADLVLIGELEDPLAVRLTNWPSPLLWSLWGTFLPAVISRGKITSQEGLQVDTMPFTWSPLNTGNGLTVATSNPYQRAKSGFYDNMKFRMWRCLMPTQGDANTFGACELFGGRIAEVVSERNRLTFNINSFADVFNQTIPPNVIEWTSTLAGYAGNTPVVADGETQLPQFIVVAPSSELVITATCTGPTPNKIYGNDKFFQGFIAFNQGSSLAGYYRSVASNKDFRSSGGFHFNQFQVYGAFPWAPAIGDTFYASTQPPINAQDGTVQFPYDGFRHVPQPESAV